MGMKKLGVGLGLGLMMTTSLLGSALPSGANEPSCAEVINNNNDDIACVLQRRTGSKTYEEALKGGRLASFDTYLFLDKNETAKMHVVVHDYAKKDPPIYGMEFNTGTLANDIKVEKWPEGLMPQGYERIKALSIYMQKGDGLDKQVLFFKPEHPPENPGELQEYNFNVLVSQGQKIPVKVFVTTYNPDLN